VSKAEPILDSEAGVVRCLLTYTDWWQLISASVLQTGGRNRRFADDGFHPGLVETLDERMEMCRRMTELTPKERDVLFFWYVSQLPAHEIARLVKISRRQCFRIRSKAVRRIVEQGRSEQTA
jgi:DNA-directed RNA polymerase specialized sigma subunit